MIANASDAIEGHGAVAPTPRWPLLVGGVLMNLALGTFYAVSYFLPPVEREFGWTRGQSSLVSTFGIAMISCWFVVGGWLNDRKGPKIVALIGGVLFSLGFLLASQVQTLWSWYLAWACIGTGNGFGYVVPSAIASKWFPDKRGLIIGLMVGGYGAGSGIFGPLALALIQRVGWRDTLQIFAALFLVMTMIATTLLRNPPESYRPPRARKPVAAATGHNVRAAEMVRSRTFWALWVSYALGTTAGTMVISQLRPFALEAGHTAAVIAFAVTVGAVGNAGGRFVSGWMSDHLGRLNTLRIMLLVSMVAMPALYAWRENVTLLYALLLVVYYCYGTQLSVYASTSADFYGTKYFGFNYGLLLLAWGVAGILGPVIGGRVHDSTGQYRIAFLAASAITLIALGTLSFARTPVAASEARSAG